MPPVPKLAQPDPSLDGWVAELQSRLANWIDQASQGIAATQSTVAEQAKQIAALQADVAALKAKVGL